MHRLVPALLLALTLTAARPTALSAQVPPPEYAARRTALATRLGDGIVLALGSHEPVHDFLSFDQNPDFRWLTGVREPGAALLMVRRGGSIAATIFVMPRDPAREVWNGTRMGTAGASRLTGLPARNARELEAALDTLLREGLPLHVVGEMNGRGDALSPHQQFVRRLQQAFPKAKVADASRAVAQLRGRKSAAELEQIRRAVEITVQAQREAMRAIEPGMNEFEVQALIEYTFRRNGAERPSFATIVGSGPNSTILHYNANDRYMQEGEVVVMDVGASWFGYAADVTRTVPVSGTFTPAQREIYQLVRDAQAAAERQVKPGAQARAMTDSAQAVIAAGLARLGLIEAPGASYDCAPNRQCPQVFLYWMHGLGHGIGLEVHDPDQYELTGIMDEGSAFTIEPGVYVRGHLLDILPDTPRNRALKEKIGAAVAKYANVGVRIEDDYLVTARGAEWVSRAPREIEEIEALMKPPFAGPAPRDAKAVEAYRQGSR